MAAHLPSHCGLDMAPCYRSALPTSDIRIDALLAIVQMPSGVPVATMAIGRAGVKNAAILSAQILALEQWR